MMSVKLRYGLRVNGFATLLVVPGIAAAQAAAGVPSAEAPQPPAPAAAQHAELETLDEIVVVAQRRPERLQEVPITVTAVSAQALQAAHVTNTADLVNVVPGLMMPTSAGYTLPHLRGVGITAIGPGIENSVALYVDGVYRGVSSSANTGLNNIAQVEVEKGPQGTLFGRNATGGLIQITTLEPTPGFSGSAKAGYANFETASGDLYVTGGTDVLAGDVAVQWTHQGEGWGTNLATGQDVNRMDLNLSMRSKWLFRPVDGTKLTLTLDETQTRNSMVALRNYQNVKNAFYPGGFASLPTFDVNDDAQPLRRLMEQGISLQLDQDLGFASLVNTVAYRNNVYRYNVDFDLGPSPYSLNDARQADNQLTEELQLLSRNIGSFTWVAGMYLYNAHDGYEPQNLYFSGPAVNPLKPITHIIDQAEQRTHSVAGYVQATQALPGDNKLTLGLRYTTETRALVGVQTGYLRGVTPVTLANVDTSIDTHTPTWRVAFDHNFAEDVLGYVSYNRGFKSGGYNVVAPVLPPYAPEKLDAYEVGLKTQFLERRLTLNTAAFYYNYNNIQVSRFVNGSPQVYNGGKATLYGLDSDVTLKVTEALTVTAGIELEHTEFKDFPNADFFLSCPGGYPAVCSMSATGKQLPQAPNASGTVNIDYRVSLMEGDLHFNLNEVANSGYYYAPNNEYRQSAYGLLSASIGWSRGFYSMSLWGKNLTNYIYPLSVNQAPTAVAAAYAAPRTFGITLGAKF
jgi:iron complex outermembrane receptor protein